MCRAEVLRQPLGTRLHNPYSLQCKLRSVVAKAVSQHAITIEAVIEASSLDERKWN